MAKNVKQLLTSTNTYGTTKAFIDGGVGGTLSTKGDLLTVNQYGRNIRVASGSNGQALIIILTKLHGAQQMQKLQVV